MSFFTEKQGEIEHEYFQAGPGKKIYLGRKDRPGEVKIENIRKALKYIDDKNQHYFEIADKLISRLSQENKDIIIPELIDRLYKKADGYVSSLSDHAKQQYLSKGKQTAESQTRLRTPKIEFQTHVSEPILLSELLLLNRKDTMLHHQFDFKKIIEELLFGVFTYDEIKKYSVAEIVIPDTYDEVGHPVAGGVMDLRLGAAQPNEKCFTCKKTFQECPGHFGHIELSKPMLHIKFADKISDLLLATCHSCYRVKISQTFLNRFKRSSTTQPNTHKIVEQVRNVEKCPHCNAKQRPLIFTKPFGFTEITENGESRLSPEMIKNRLSHIPDDDLFFLGYNLLKIKPEWFVIGVLPVPPVTIRPPTYIEGKLKHDDITLKLIDIVRINERLKESGEAGTPDLIVQDLEHLLQYHVATYYDNKLPNSPAAVDKTGKPLVTLTEIFLETVNKKNPKRITSNLYKDF